MKRMIAKILITALMIGCLSGCNNTGSKDGQASSSPFGAITGSSAESDTASKDNEKSEAAEESSEESSAAEKESEDESSEDIEAQTLQKAAELAEDEKYADAISLIKNNDLISGNEDVYESYCEDYKDQLFSKIDDQISEGNYLETLNMFKEALRVLDEDEEINAKREECLGLYITDVVSKAETALESEDKDGAIEIIDEALSYFPENDILLDEKEKIESGEAGSDAEVSVAEGESDLVEPTETVALGKSTVKDGDDNDSAEKAQSITLGDSIEGSISVEGDIDFYSFTLKQSGIVTLNMKSYMKYYCIYIYDEAGTEVWYTNENEYNSTVGFRQDDNKIALEKGTYSFKITGNRYSTYSASTGNYELKTSFESAMANEQESNNNAGEANKIVLAQTINGLIASNDRMDFYQFTIDNSGKISLDVTSYMKYYTIIIYDTEGTELWKTNDNEYNSTVGFRNDKYGIYLEKGTYYIRVTGYKYDGTDYPSTGKYTIKTGYTNAKATETEPNNAAEQANEIKFNTEVVGLIGSNDTFDFYKIKLNSSKGMNIDFTSYMQYYTISIYDTSGNELWNTDNNEYNSTAGFRTDTHKIDLEKGTYYIKITGYLWANDTTYYSRGTYKFTLALT